MINKGDLVEINKSVFSTGDVYLLDNENVIYIWIGSKCSVDEKTAGAAQARTLDDQRGGAAKIITVDQDQETPEFLKLISTMGAMKIVEKNIAKTMLKDVSTGDFAGFEDWQNVLYRVSSEEFDDINSMKMVQVPYSKDSLESEDCFIADLGNKIYVWQGNSCNVKEKVKSGQWARGIDADRAGDQNEKIFEEGDDTEFLEALAKGVDYKESDAFQLRAESELDADTEADVKADAIEKEHKTEVIDSSSGAAAAASVAKSDQYKSTVSSGSAPGMPGQVDDSILTIEKKGRHTCPKCGNVKANLIHESLDKTNIVLDYPRMYGKKYRCGKCGQNWREK